MKKVAVIGYGYVGKQMAALLSHAHHVYVYDPNYDIFSGVPEHIKSISDENDDIVKDVDLAVICVPTPSLPDGSCDTSIVEEVCGWIDAPLVVIKSTVPPGFTARMNVNQEGSIHYPEPLYDRFHFSPEYTGEPINYVPPQYPNPRDSRTHDFCIVGGPRASEVLDFFAACMATSARYVATDSTTAELCKYMENAYFAMKVMFCTEFYMMAQKSGVDYKELRNLWTLDGRVDPDHTMVFPDKLGFGGKCLPKDLSAIIEWSKANSHTPMLLEILQIMNKVIRNEVTEDRLMLRLYNSAETEPDGLWDVQAKKGCG